MDATLIKNLEPYYGMDGNTILILQEIQNHHQYLPEAVLEEASRKFHIPVSDFYSVATFYSQFKFKKPGEFQVKVCHGTACHINGAVAISEALEESLEIVPGDTTKDGRFSLENVACLGCCSLAPVIMINDQVYGNLDDRKVIKVLQQYRG